MKKELTMTVFLASAVVMPAVAGGLRNPFENINLLDSSRIHDLDEIIVVSQPKERFRLRQQPLSSNAFSTQELNKLGVRDVRELSVYVPSFVMPNYGSRLTSSVYVRGIGSRVNSPAVGFYMDGIPLISKSALNFHTYQIDRIDILRGPQGTLYGQNTEGGLVKLFTKNPLHYQGTDINLGIGSRLYRNVEFAHYAKLTNRLGVSVAGFYNGQNGFFRNQTTNERADQYNEAGGRFRLSATPTDHLTLDFLADYQYVNQNGFPYGTLEADGTTARPSANRQATYRRNILNTAFSLGFKANHFDFSSITSYQYLRDFMFMDQDYLPQDFMHLEQCQLQNAFTQEFTLKGNHAVGGFWHWTAGAFFSTQWLKTVTPVYFDAEMNKAVSHNITKYAYNGILKSLAKRFGSEAAAAAFIKRMGGCKVEVELSPVLGTFRTPMTNLAFFHESNFDITKRLAATLGLRYDYSHVAIDYETSASIKLSQDVIGRHADATIYTSLKNNTDHDDFNQLLPKFGLTYKFGNHGSNVYGLVSKGYRAGGFNIQMFSDILQAELSKASQRAVGNITLQHDAAYYEKISKTISYKPETSWNYEVGTHLNLFEGALHFDLSAFFMQVRNQQLSVMAGEYGFGRMMTNAGKSESCGFETSLRGNVFNDHLNWGVNYGFTRAVFKDYTSGEGTNKVSYVNNYVPFAPKHTLGAYADYRLDFKSMALHSITLGANANAQGKVYWDEANLYSQKFYGVLGAHADADFGKIVLSVWGRNLTNTRYNTFAAQSAATGKTYTFAQLGNPFQCGVDVRLHF